MLVNALSSEDEELVEFADEALSRFGTNIVTPVRSLLTHEHEEVVERALEALRHVRNASVVPLARPFAAHRYSPYRRAAATALTGTDSQPGLALLERLAADPIVSVRLSAARALEGYQRAEIRNLLSQLVRDRDEEVAIQALDLLSGDPGGASYIVDYLNQPVVTFGEQAVLALARTQSNQALNVLIEWLRRGESRFRSALRQGIVTFGRRGVEALLEAAIVDSRLRLDAQKILNTHPTIAAPLIVKVIKRNPAGAPSFVIEALGQNAGSASLKVLDQAYQSGGIQVKMSVVKTWGNYRGELVAKRLMAALQSGNPALKTTAVKAIGNAQVKEAAMPLVKLLTEKDFPAHLAISALGKLRSTAASPHLVIRFSTAPLSERFAILHACSAMQTPSCIKLLYGATDDDDKDVRKEALKLIASR
jgi:HEAT repeat protein